jgi:hypothetical protein
LAKATPQAEPGIDQVALFTKVGFTPHSTAQQAYCSSKARFNIPCCGRRWGKSQAAGHRMTYKSFVPDSYNWIVGPTYKLGEKEFRVVYNDYEKLNLLKFCKKSYAVNQGNMRIETPWHSVVEVVSAEKPDGLLGEGLSHAIMSEAAKHRRETWEQYVEPALSDLLGTCDFPSTPQGYNWYHGLWLMGQSGFADFASTADSLLSPIPDYQQSTNNQGLGHNGPMNYKSWQFPSWTNPIRYPGGLENTEIQRLKMTASPMYFEQEYGAQFTSMTGAIYDEWNPDIHVPAAPIPFNPNYLNFLAFDYGFANPFVALDIMVTPSDEVLVWREYYSRYISTFEHAQLIKQRENPPNYRVDAMWGDPRGADEAATLSLLLGGYVASTDVSWKLGTEAIKQLLKPDPTTGQVRLQVSPTCINLARQMGQLHVKDSARRQQDLQEMVGDGNIQHKIDDHAADALRYFVGPYFVLDAGSHMEDLHGASYKGSESEDFFKLHSQMTLTDKITLF